MNDEQDKMIRFLDSDHKTLFYLPDGENIMVTRFDGEKLKFQCQFLDSCHLQVGGETFHNCQFADLMARAGNTYAPEQPPPLPDKCYAVLPDSGELVFIEKGKKGYRTSELSTDSPQANRKKADDLNISHKISRQQSAAMLGGATRGWSSPAARTSSYDVHGEPVKPPPRARGRKPKAKTPER